MKSYFTTIIAFSFFAFVSSFSQAQHGEVDFTFLPYDTSAFQSIGGANYAVYKTVMQPDGRILVGGDFTTYKNQPVHRLMRLNPNGTLDQSFLQDEIAPSYTIRSIALQPDGKIIVGGNFTTWNGVSTSIVRLHPDGTLDNTFSVPGSANGAIWDIEVTPDGKIIVAGSFTAIAGTNESYLIRLLSDGTLDNSFPIGTGPNNFVSDVVQRPSGELLLAGHFTSFNSTTTNGYVQLQADGTIDPAFTLNQVNDYIQEILLQPDGKIVLLSGSTIYRLLPNGLVDGSFVSSVNSGVTMGATLLSSGKIVAYGYNFLLVRNADGTIDTGFNASLNSEDVFTVTEQSNGDLIVGGDFVFINQVSGENLCGVDMTGNITPYPMGFDFIVYTISVQPDNKIIAGGFYNTYMGVPAKSLVRLFPNGELDTAFLANLGTGFNMEIFDTYLLDDGRILVGGSFTQADGHPSTSLARVLADGTVDTSFHPPVFDGTVNSIEVLPDGKIVVAGGFNYVDGQQRYYVVRLFPDGALDPSFTAPFNANVVFAMQAYKVVALPDGKLLVGGRFACCYSVVRLHPNGSMDNSFSSLITTYSVRDILPLEDGTALIGGTWSSFAGHSVQVLDRLLPNGMIDPAFNHYDGGSSGFTQNTVANLLKISDNQILVSGKFSDIPGNNRNCFLIDQNGIRDTQFDVNQSFGYNGNAGFVLDVGIQSDGRIIIGGSFPTIGNFRRNNIARLHRSTFIADTICSEQDYIFGSQVITNPATGTYYEVYQSGIGTDSTVVLNLSVTTPNINVSQNGTVLTSGCTNCDYQWVSCSGGMFTEIPGATNSVFTAPQSGDYAVIVSMNGCTDTSDCLNVNDLDLSELSGKQFQIYPNPANDYVTISLAESFESGSVYIADMTGKIVWQSPLVGKTGLLVNQKLEKGVYTVVVNSGTTTLSEKLIVQ